MKLLSFVAVFIYSIVFFTCVFSKKDYSGYKLLQIPISQKNDVQVLLELQENNPEVEFTNLPSTIGDVASCIVPPDVLQSFSDQLNDAGITFTMADIGEQIENERAAVEAKSRLSLGGFDLFNYNRHSDINNYLDELVNKCDEKGLVCETFSIGESYEGRNMKVIKIGTSHSTGKPAIWIDAGIHAREWIAPATAIIIANRLIFMYGVQTQTTEVLDKFDWYILPSANPDGYEYSWDEDRYWRKTRSPNEGSDCVGTDPNRNWDHHWMETGASNETCSQIYAGSRPFSEVETQAISNFLLDKSRNFLMYISLHAYGQYWLTPWGYTEEVPSDYDELLDLGHTAADTIWNLYGKDFTVGSSTNVLCGTEYFLDTFIDDVSKLQFPRCCIMIEHLDAAAGASMDWAKGVAGIDFSLTAELRDRGEYGFTLPPSEIKQVGREMWLGIRALALRGAEIRNIN